MIVHPPCDIDRFQWSGQGDYSLSTARLVPLKRINAIVEAFRAMPDKQLVVASGGVVLTTQNSPVPSVEYSSTCW